VKIDAMLSALPLRQMADAAAAIERAGFDGLCLTESGRTAYLGCTAAALATSDLEIGTGVAVAFPRSPMVTASIAWELAEATNGQFLLGLGTQVKAHIVRRYSSEFSHPGPRMREYVRAVRAIWRAFQGEEKLDFHGDFYTFDLMPSTWSAGPIEHPHPPIYVAAVRPWMLQMCGEVADGVHVHPLHTAHYLETVILPNVAEGAARAGRDPSEIALACPVMTITGDTEEELAAWRERARMQIAFYGSTPGYGVVFDAHGWEGMGDELNRLQRVGDMAGMARVVTDEVVDAVAVEATWDRLAAALHARFSGTAERLICYYVGSGLKDDPGVLERWADVAAEVHRLEGSH
jgi:probable F420-dependent oxidoreductase